MLFGACSAEIMSIARAAAVRVLIEPPWVPGHIVAAQATRAPEENPKGAVALL